jgi:hypothetical protein
VALFTRAPAGSGILTPIWPTLTFRYSTDGLGLVFEDPSSGFLLVWNADYLPRAIEYSPGLFTPVLVEHTAFNIEGVLNGWLGEGPTVANFKSYPQAIAYDAEITRYATEASEWGFPTKYTGSGSPTWDRDSDWNTHTTGSGRRWITWPPLRGARYHSDPTMQAAAFTATRGWCLDQLRRPWAHISAPFTPFKGIVDYDNFTINNGDANRGWDMNKKVKVKDRTGTLRDINNFDPGHGVSLPPFAFACMDHPLGVVLLWLHAIQFVQGVPPNQVNQFGSYSFPFDQERSIAWMLELYKHCCLVGFDYMDPDLQVQWWGGLRPGAKGNNGLGWTPRAALQAALDTFCGPEYGGRTSANPRFVQRTEDTNDDGFDADGHQQPYMNLGTRFSKDGNDYRRCFASEKAFHRYLCSHAMIEAIRVHDHLAAIDPTDTIIDLARVSELRRFRTDYVDFVTDTGYIGDADGTLRGFWRQRTHVFQHAVSELGFADQAALYEAIELAISHDPKCPYPTSNPPDWVFPGVDSGRMQDIFGRQHTRWTPGLGTWHLVGGRPISSNGGADTEAHITGVPFYAERYGYDDALQAMFAAYSSEMNDLSNTSNISHYEPYWRAKELFDTSGQKRPPPSLAIAVSVPPTYTLSDIDIEFNVPPAVATAASVAPSVTLGSVSVTPAELTAVAVSVAPTNTTAAVLFDFITPPPAFVTVAARVPTVVLGNASPPPSTAGHVVCATSVSYQLGFGSPFINVTPEPATARASSTLGEANLGDVSPTLSLATARAVSVPPGVSFPGTIFYAPEEATAVADGSLFAYLVLTLPKKITPPAAFAQTRAFVDGAFVLGDVAPAIEVGYAVVEVDPGDYELDTIPPLVYFPPEASCTTGAVSGGSLLGDISREPEVATAIALADGPGEFVHGHVAIVPEVGFANAASELGGIAYTETRIPRNVVSVGIELGDPSLSREVSL